MLSDPKSIIEEFFAKANISYKYDEREKQFRAIMKFKNVSGQDHEYPIAVTIISEWVITEAAIVDLNNTPDDISLEKLYDGMLRANHLYPELNYSIAESFVLSQSWGKISGFNLENFMAEFEAAKQGVERFHTVVTYAKHLTSKPPKSYSPMYQ